MKDCLTLPMWHTKNAFSSKCNFGRIAIQWFHIKHYLDYQYTKFQPYTFRVQKMCVFARYATLVPRLKVLNLSQNGNFSFLAYFVSHFVTIATVIVKLSPEFYTWVIWLLSGQPGCTCWISFALVFMQFYLLLSPYLCFIAFLYLDSYVLGDDASIS